MTKRVLWTLMAVTMVALINLPVAANDAPLDPLLELLVEQGVITHEQAVAVQAEKERREQAVQEPATANAEQAPVAPVTPAEDHSKAFKGVKDLKIGTLAYLSYQDGSDAAGEDYSQFRVKRAYVDIRKKLTDHIDVRVTPDAHLDDTGDLKVRLKYLYARFGFENRGILNHPHVEFGMAHMPWLDFEEHINRFRMQDTMFMERNSLFNSADFGILFASKLGEDLPKEDLAYMDSHYGGRWGSFGVGVFDGGGYHSGEKNNNKVLEGRFTLRPLPDVAPGLQASVFGVSGKGNTSDDGGLEPPDWEVLAAMLSYESPRFVVTAQYADGKGNQKGSAVDAAGKALPFDGYSLFTELRVDPARKWSLIGRYDFFDADSDDPLNDERERYIAGVAWQFAKGNYWVLDYDRVDHSAAGLETEDRIQLTLQIKY